MDEKKIGLQLYSVREDCAKDLQGSLAKIAEMGYAGIEFAGFYDYAAPELKKILDDIGLACCGSHTPVGDLLGDKLNRTVEFNLELGNKFLIVPGLPDDMKCCLAAWKKSAELLDEISEKLKPFGARTGYHNHFTEFTPVEGGIPWEVIMDNTNPGFIMQIDTGNALKGGCRVEDYIEKYPGRSATVHLKEYSASNDKAVIGEGDVNWEKVFRLCEEKGGTDWYIVEQESYARPPMECAWKCLENLNSMQ